MAENKQTTSGRLFDNKKFVLLFSIITAIIFWMVITVTESPDSENTIGGLSISIPTENSVVSELGLDVIDDITNFKASVTVTGPAYVVGTLGQNDLAVTASVSHVTSAGTYELELRAMKQSGGVDSDYEIVSISPSRINVTFDYIDTKQFTVIPKAVGASAIEGLVAENPVVSDSNNATLTFKGSRTNMEKISSVEAVAEVNSVLSETKTFPSVLKIYDIDGNLLPAENYTITSADGVSAPNVQVSVPISKMKSVPVKAMFINVPKALENEVAHSLSYSYVDIIGPPATVDNINSISLSEINFDNISENGQKFTAGIILPDGVKCVDNIDSVEVTVTGLKNHTVKTYTVSNIGVKTNTKYTVTLSRNIRNVKICGSRSVLNKISSSDLYAEVDVEGLLAGEHTVSARIVCKVSNEVWQVGTYTATVNIK